MPIRFRCAHCGQLLSITRRKAGQSVTCPACVHRIHVPTLEEARAQAASSGESAVEDPGQEDSGMRLELVATRQSPAAESTEGNPWDRHPDPWRHSEDEEEEFRISATPLEESGLDMTPMVDVTFLLLIFFMITASFSLQKSLETNAPDPDDEGAAQTMVLEDIEEDSIVVTIDEENRIFVDDLPVAGIGPLRDALIASSKRDMLIEADPMASHGTVVAVTDAGMDANMQQIRRASSKGGGD